MNWDDLRFFLAIARAESLSAAGRTLGVSQPTVSRRLAAMEDRLGVRLFDRTAQGYAPTAAGGEILETAMHLEDEFAGIERRLFGRDLRLTGSLRVTCTEVLANCYLARHLSRFLAEHPEIELNVICTFQQLSLGRREADVAIRMTNRPPDTLIGRRLATVAIGVYGATDTEADTSRSRDWNWIGWQDEAYNRMMIANSFPEAQIRHRVDDLLAMRSMVRAGIGVAVLPCYVADPDPLLRRMVSEPLTQGAPDLWVLSHPDVRRAARVRLFTEFIAEAILADRDMFEGRLPQNRGP